MGKIGLKNTDRKLLRRFDAAISTKGRRWAGLLKKEIDFAEYLTSFVELVALLEDIRETNNIAAILKAEQFLVKYDSDHYCQTSGSIKRQETIRDQLADLERLLNYRELNPDGYDLVSLNRLESRQVRSGLPLDGIRRVLASHIVRTDREVASRSDGYPPEQLAYLHVRQANVKKMEDLYQTMQREGLAASGVAVAADGSFETN